MRLFKSIFILVFFSQALFVLAAPSMINRVGSGESLVHVDDLRNLIVREGALGERDVTDLIQLLIDRTGPNAVVQIPSGKFLISKSLIPLVGQTILGAGVSTLILNTNNDLPAFLFYAPPNSEVEGPKFVNFHLNSKFGIFVNHEGKRFPTERNPELGYVMRTHIQRVKFSADVSGGVAMRLVCIFDSEISLNYSNSEFEYFIDLYGSDINLIRDNRSTNVVGAHVRDRAHLTFGSTNLISHNDFIDMAAGARAMIITSARWAKISDNYFEQLHKLNEDASAIVAYDESGADRQFGLELVGNRFDIDARQLRKWLDLKSSPYQIVVGHNVFLSPNRPGVSLSSNLGYYFSINPPTRRLISSDVQPEVEWPFVSSTTGPRLGLGGISFNTGSPGLTIAGYGRDVIPSRNGFVLPAGLSAGGNFIEFSSKLYGVDTSASKIGVRILARSSADNQAIKVVLYDGGVVVFSKMIPISAAFGMKDVVLNLTLKGDLSVRIYRQDDGQSGIVEIPALLVDFK